MFGSNGGFNPMQMMQMMGGGGQQNPMQMMSQMMGGGGMPGNMPFNQNQIAGMNPQQIQQMANQMFGGKAPSPTEIQGKMEELKKEGKVMVINNQQLYQMISQAGGHDSVRYANVPQSTIMTLADYNNVYGG